MNDIKFETINGQLCRMVEPEPLTDKSQFPCVVRLIQDDSPMGRANKMHGFTSICLQNTYLAESVTNYSMLTNDYKPPIDCYAYYEIIGYPVVEGSKEWALYQMMQGKKVRYKGAIGNVYWALNQDGNVQYYDMADPAYVGTIRSKLEFGERTWDYHWQLYKEPQLIDSDRWACFECGVKDSRKGHFPGCSRDVKPKPTYKVGDWVEYKNGKHHQVDSVHDGCCYLSYGKGCGCFSALYSDITRKLEPSEVRVRITLEGQVTKPVDNAGGRFWLFYSTDEYLSVELDALSNKDRELVEKLLKAQEE